MKRKVVLLRCALNAEAKRPLWFEATYLCLTAVGFSYGAWGLPWYVRHSAQFAVLVAGAGVFLMEGGRENTAALAEFSGVFTLPFVGMLAYSMICWAIDLRTLPYISRGCSTVLYCLLALASMSMAVYLFGRRAVDYTLYGMCAANLSIVCYSVKCYGAAQLLRDLNHLVLSAGVEAGPAAKVLEVHDLTFAFGLMALYYLLFTRQRGHFFMALFFFLLGWKLIGVLGFAASAAVFLWMRKRRKRAVPFLAAAAFLVCGFYIVSIRNGWFDEAVEALEIDTRGRRELYAAFREEYVISPLFRGYGIGYTTRTIRTLTEQGVGIFATHDFGALHNDLLTMYLELGFWGSMLWFYDCWCGRILYVWERFGKRTALLLLCETVYVFVTYATDNTAFYCYVNAVFVLLPLAAVLGEKEEGP